MRTHGRALSALYVGAVLIAFSPIFVRLSELPPVATAFYRTLLAAPLFAAWAWFDIGGRASAWRRSPGSWLPGLAAAGLLFAGDLAVWHWSITLTSVANATLLANLAPVLVTLLAWARLGERPTPRFVVGLALAVAGVAMLMRSSVFAGDHALRGDLLGVLTAVFYGAYIIAVKQLRATLPTAWLMFGISVISSGCLLLIATGRGETIWPRTPGGWAVLFALAWCSQFAGQGLIAHALAHLRASYSSVVLLLQPVTAAILAWLLFSERMSWLQAGGALVVLAGIRLAGNGARGGSRG